MSRAYTTTSRTTTATRILYPPIDGRDTVMGGPTTTEGISRSQIGREGFQLSTTTKSANEYNGEERRAYAASHPRRCPAQSTPLAPPPLLHTKCVPLPALADVPIYVNPLLSYNPSRLVLEYDLRLPPITAHLPPIARAHVGHLDWKEQPAMSPSTVGSMAIVVPGVERVVVVFPEGNGVVTVGDVLLAVYRALQESGIERNGELGAKCGSEGRKNWPASRQVDNSNTTAVREETGQEYWWAGIYPCHRERDVWVLRTRRGDQR